MAADSECVPFPSFDGSKSMLRSKVVQILKSIPAGTEVDVRGWVRTKRESKQDFAFLEVNDGSCLANVQVVVDATVPDYATLIKQIHTGASVAIVGEVKDSPGKGQRVEVQARSLKVLGTADPQTYPLQKKGHSFEFLREKAHLRPRTNTFGAIARVRNALCAAIHNFFQTPIITTSDCEGAGQIFQVTTLDLAKLQQIRGPIDYGHDFFGKKAGLTVSGQLEGEIYATAVGDVYTFGPTFRAENSNTTRHLAEFWMIEPEMAFCDLRDAVL
jgi:asparaginyl-tRNA synthetase